MVVAFAMIYFALPKKNAVVSGSAGLPATGSTTSKCEADLVKLLVSIDPARVQFNIDLEGRLAALNRYWSSCGPQSNHSIVKDLAAIQSTLSGPTLERTLSPRIVRRDLEHLRQALLFQRIAKRLGEGRSNDLQRVLAHFVYVAQQLEPLPRDSAADQPLTPYECLMFGEGTPEHRGWLLAELLRQLHLDAVAIEHPQGKCSPLIGVILDKSILLYDPVIGFPIPAAGESQRSQIFREPASLEAVLADDAILRQLDLEGQPYPWTSADLKAATIGLIGTAETWSPRMADLQFQLPAEPSCVIYDGLGSSENVERGLRQRVVDLVQPLGYTPSSVKVWAFPEEQTVALDQMGDRSAPHVAKRIAILSGPYRSIGGAERAAKDTLQRARALQLLGQWTDAIGAFIPIHQAAAAHGTANNLRATELAIYWTAATQYENQDFPACVGTLNRYLKDYPLGNMRDAILVRVAACLSVIQQYEEASTFLGQVEGPQRWRCQLLTRRLREIAALAPAVPSPATTEAPTAPAPEAAPPASGN